MLLPHLFIATIAATTLLKETPPLKAEKKLLPIEWQKFAILRPGERLIYNSVEQMKSVKVIQSNFWGKELVWTSNGTHVSAFAAIRYKSNLSVGGLIWASMTVTFFNDNDKIIGYFSGRKIIDGSKRAWCHYRWLFWGWNL